MCKDTANSQRWLAYTPGKIYKLWLEVQGYSLKLSSTDFLKREREKIPANCFSFLVIPDIIYSSAWPRLHWSSLLMKPDLEMSACIES